MAVRRLKIGFGERFMLTAVALLSFVCPLGAADKIRIGYSGATVSNAMLWVTDEGKLFQKKRHRPANSLFANDAWPDGDDRRRNRYVCVFRQSARVGSIAGRRRGHGG
jgi:ATP-dependent DNA ligase